MPERSVGEDRQGVYICPLCRELVHHADDDPTVWKRVTGWVGGPKKDSMRLRDDTGEFAHDECIKRVQRGQAPDQADLFEE